MKKYSIVLGLLVFAFNCSLIAAPKKTVASPQRLLFLVFDQMRPDYVDRFDLKNFKRLRSISTNYPEAYVGHSSSITVVSHLVMTTGLLPKDLPWLDNVYFDTGGLIGEKNKIHRPQNLSMEEAFRVLKAYPENTYLSYQLKNKLGKKSYVIAQKPYAAITFGGPWVDSAIYMKKEKGEKASCSPEGFQVPESIQKNPRYKIDCSEKYGTEQSFYPLDGNMYYPGKDPQNLGGDIWIADAALEIMNQDRNWGGLFLTFGAIDRFGHMLGQTDGENPLSYIPPATLKEIAQIADAQLGRLLDHLRNQNLLQSTMIVLTADHGGQTDKIYLGALGGESFFLSRLQKMGGIKALSADTQMRLWLQDPSKENLEKAENVLKETSRLTAIYRLDESHKKYQLSFSRVNEEPKAFQAWSKKHDQELVDSMASSKAPHLVGLLADDVGFGKLGDHGGQQEKVQRIPMMIYLPGKKGSSSKTALRLVDLTAEIRKAFQL